MKKEKRYLITTADERTWKFDRPVLFLGEWCRNYNRKHIWENMDAVIAAPYGLGLAKKDADHAEARALEEQLFPEFYRLLNEYHGTDHDERFWRIVLGHWFRRIINLLLNRLNTLELCLQEYDISATAFYNNEYYALATPDSYSAIWACNDDRWNNALNYYIFSLLETGDISVDFVEEENCSDTYQGYRFERLHGQQSFSRRVVTKTRRVYENLFRLWIRDKDAFIINSYLPLYQEIKLNLTFWQLPKLWRSPKLEIFDKPDYILREKLRKKIKIRTKNNLESIAVTMLFKLIPVCYLEGFSKLNEKVKKLPWPKNPRFIFTSGSYDTDEIFKLWAAIKVEDGVKYYTGQHGNNPGVYRYFSPSIQEITSNKFITWGWVDGMPQHTPAFCFKTFGRKSRNYNSKGGLLLIERCLPHRISSWDGCSEFADYFKQQVDFVVNLAIRPRESLIIRLHADYRYKAWDEEARWGDFDPKLKIDTGAESIRKIISGSRLIVHSYDSTGIIETLCQNVPTLAFWQDGFDHLRESAKPYYQLLLDAGIVHLSSESVAKSVNIIWDDVDSWWYSSQTQEARMKFCERYGKRSNKPVKHLAKVFGEL